MSTDNKNQDTSDLLDYFSTKLAHPDEMPTFKGSSNPPVHHTSTILFDNLEDFYKSEQRHDERGQSSYGIYGNTASYMLEEMLTEMESGAGSVITSSGLSAITMTLNALLKSGDHVLVTDSAYEPVRQYCSEILQKNGIEVDYYSPEIGADIASLFKPNTALILLESPGSMSFDIQDTPAICEVAKKAGVLTAMDNTWSTPLYHRPLKLGVDVSMHAVTKYMAGHSDLLMGAIIANDKTIKAIKHYARLFGNYVGSDDIFLAIRGLRTMPHRLRVHEANAIRVAKWLESKMGQYPICKVIHPALPSHPQHAIWKRDFTGSTGLFSFVLSGVSKQKLSDMMDGLKYYGKGFSWGGYSSLMTPGRLQMQRKHQPDLGDAIENVTIIRIYIGLEHVDDLIADLEAGLNRL